MKTGQVLKAYLDEVGVFCRKRGVPDLATIVVSKSSRDSGDPLPSENAFGDDGKYGLEKLSRQQVRDQQARVITHDWASEVWVH